jgi:hypothetical protein
MYYFYLMIFIVLHLGSSFWDEDEKAAVGGRNIVDIFMKEHS